MCSCSKNVSKESVELITIVDTLQTTIGEPIKLSLSINHPDSNIIQIPLDENSSSLQIKSLSNNHGRGTFVADYNITFWDTGLARIPNILINILDKDSTLIDSMSTQSYAIDVISVKQKIPSLEPKNDQVMPIKSPVPVRKQIPLVLIVQIIALILLSFILFYLWSKRVARVNTKQTKKRNLKESTLELTLKKLKELEKIDLNNESNKKVFYVNLSFILRDYIEKSFFVRTLEMTTLEIAENKSLFPFGASMIDKFIQILQTSDLVKYARYDSDKFQRDLKEAILFVENTSKYLTN